MDVKKINIDDNIYDLILNTEEEIILERFDNEIGMKFKIAFENSNKINIEIKNDLTKKFLNRVTSFTHLINEN